MAPRPKIDDFRVTGRLVADPEPITTPGGRNLTTFRVAENNRQFDRDSEQWVDADATYYDVAIPADVKRLGNLATNAGKSLHKGDRVTVEGSYSATAFIDRTGQAQVGHKIWAEDVSPSMRYAEVQINDNPRPSAQTSQDAEQYTQWETAVSGADLN